MRIRIGRILKEAKRECLVDSLNLMGFHRFAYGVHLVSEYAYKIIPQTRVMKQKRKNEADPLGSDRLSFIG